jgi:hypothetical protein
VGRLYEDVRIIQVATVTAGAAGQTAITSAAVDTAGYESCTFIVGAGAITTAGVQSLKVQQSSDDAAADDYSDVLGTSQTIADDADNTSFYVDVHRPGKRYLKLVVSRATQNSTFGAIYALLSNPRRKPASHTTVTGEAFASPIEGTA